MEIKLLESKTIVAIDGLEKESEEVMFLCSDGTRFKMYHEQDCCENVSIDDVVGDIEDILNSPIIKAEEKQSEGTEHDYGTSTWTFYTIATIKGYVDIKWYGESNGYYSESVTFEEYGE